MTRRDAAVLLFVGAGIYCLVRSLGFLSTLIELFAPPVRFPLTFNTTVNFLSYLVPFGLLLAGGPLLIQARHALAKHLFDQDEALPTPNDQPARAQALGSIALAALGLLCFFDAVGPLATVIRLAQPYSWQSTSASRMIIFSVLNLDLLLAYLWLGWWLVSRRERLAARWLVPAAKPPQEADPESKRWEALTFRVVGLYFMMFALWPLTHALVTLVTAGASGDVPSAKDWDFWVSATRGVVGVLFGLSVFAGRKGIVAAWRRVFPLSEV